MKKDKWTRKKGIFKSNRKFHYMERLIHCHHLEISIENFNGVNGFFFKNKVFGCISPFLHKLCSNSRSKESASSFPSKFSYSAYFAMIDKQIPSPFLIIYQIHIGINLNFLINFDL